MRALVWALRVICLTVALWGIYGFGGDTLVDLAARGLHLPYGTAAFLVSVLVASLGTASALFSMWRTRDSSEQDGE